MSNKTTKINQSDLKFYPPERLNDTDEGGGLALGTSIQGEANEIFDPISSIDKVNGGFHVRKIFAGLQRADDEKLIGAHVAITKPPADPSVSYLLFRADKFGEQRADGAKRIEAFSVATIESRMTLLSTQAKHSRIVQTYQRVGEPLPLVGDVYCLRQDKAGYEKVEQYIQVVSVKSEERTFTTPEGKDFVRTVVQLETSQKLNHDFIGVDYPKETYVDNPCKVRETHVADAAQYYGVKPLVAAIKAGSLKCQVSTLMEKLIPTNQVETALIDLSASGQAQSLFDASKQGEEGVMTLTISAYHQAGSISQFYTGNPILPKSLTLDSSVGELKEQGGQLYLADSPIGTVDYGSGLVIINEPSFTATISRIKFRPSCNDVQVADTAKIDVTINNRSYNYVTTIMPAPAVGSLQVSYRSQGRWIDLRDNGQGVLVGASAAYGSGAVNFNTGTINLSCGELPDVDSSILLSWGTTARYFNRTGLSTKPKLVLTLAHNADPDTITLSFNHNGTKSAQGSISGNITGDLTGKYHAASRQIVIDTTNLSLPEGVLSINASYSHGEKIHQEHKAPLRNIQGKVPIDLGDTPIKPGSVRLRWNLLIENFEHITLGKEETSVTFVDPYKTVRDDGNGKLVDEKGQQVGSINYTNASLEFTPDTTVSIPKARYNKLKIGEKTLSETQEGNKNTRVYQDIFRNVFAGYEYVEAGASMPIDETALVEVWFFDTNPKSTTTEVLAANSFHIDLLEHYSEVVAPGSVNFSLAGDRFFDKQGKIYYRLNAVTGASTLVGSINYQTGVAILNNFNWHHNNFAVAINSLATSISGNPVDSITLRTPSAPIRPSSLQIRATATDGTALTATANAKGELVSEFMQGLVDVEYGVASVKFGKLVDASGKENEPWYNAEAVKDGKIWQPKHVFAHSITYNAVAYSYLPIDGHHIKIDTARLPQDGRIPIFRRGDTILIGNRQSQNIGSAHSAGQTVQLDRQNLDRICIMDNKDKPVLATLWDYDLDAGSITWETPLDLSGYELPLKVMHAKEEKNRILQVDIDGTLTLMFPLRHDYPIEDTYVSSVLIGGDLAVRTSVPFTQSNWDNVWRDTPNGEQLLNSLNVKDYPIVLTDDGAITERWLIKFTSGSQFELYGETLGFVIKTDTLQNLAPINPSTNKPYFTIPKEAFGGSQGQAPWQTQNVIRFNTTGTLLPFWVLRAVQPTSAKQQGEDGFTLCLFGDTTEI